MKSNQFVELSIAIQRNHFSKEYRKTGVLYYQEQPDFEALWIAFVNIMMLCEE